MINYIKKLEIDLNIQLFNSLEPLRGKNTFHLSENGTVKGLVLKNLELRDLDVLLPIAVELTELSVERCKIEDLLELKNFLCLEKLNLSYNPFISAEIKNLSFLSKLKILELNGTSLNDTRILGELTALQELAIGGLEELKAVIGLEKLESLKRLELDYSLINSFEKIGVHENLQSINLKSGKIHQIVGIDRFPNLTELSLAENPISKIQNLNHLKQLKRLNLSTTWIDKIEGLEHLSNLETLDLSNQKIAKIEGLNSLINLKKLNLSENKISKVENLDNLVNLEYLLLDCNEIETFDAAFLTHLNSPCFISLVGNPINKLDVDIPKNIKVQFEEENWVPKSI